MNLVNSMNPQQEKRYAKLRSERFYLLGHETDSKGNYQYHISGSTRNVYTVTIYPTDVKIFCTCPDAKSWAAKYNCICKHALFVLYRVLKVFDKTTHPFFDRLWFTPVELECIQLSTEFLQSHLDDRVVKQDLVYRFKALCDDTVDNENTPVIRFDSDDLCGVCFLELADSSEAFIACPKCKKVAHKECVDKWVSSGQQLCVYCRQDVWGKVINRSSGDYKNLGY